MSSWQYGCVIVKSWQDLESPRSEVSGMHMGIILMMLTEDPSWKQKQAPLWGWALDYIKRREPGRSVHYCLLIIEQALQVLVTLTSPPWRTIPSNFEPKEIGNKPFLISLRCFSWGISSQEQEKQPTESLRCTVTQVLALMFYWSNQFLKNLLA